MPLKDKKSETTAAALKTICEKEMGLPLQAYTDEGGEFVKDFEQKLKY